MQRSPYVIIGIFLALVAGLFIVQTKLFDGIIYFLLAGAIPGTAYAVSPLIMFITFIVALWLVAIYLSLAIIDNYKTYREAQKILERSRRLPRRRYQQY